MNRLRQFRIEVYKIVSHFHETFYISPSKLLLFIAAGILLISTGIASQFFVTHYKREFLAQILAEGFGVVIDIVVLGVMMIWINSVNDKKRTIAAATQEIEDLRLWISDHNPEEEDGRIKGSEAKLDSAEIALHRWQVRYSALKIIRHIKVLNKLGVHKIMLNHCHLSNANLTHQNLEGSNMDLIDANHATFINGKLNHTSMCSGNLRYADFRHAELKHVKANGADFNYAIMIGAEMTNGLFINTSFIGTKLNDAIFKKAHLRGADFSGAFLVNVDFTGATGLTANQLSKAKYLLRCILPADLQAQVDEIKRSKDYGLNGQPRQEPLIQRIAV